ncbi:restriction endonuclease subunit S [Escherichia coli]|uniref:restriction endonuclease subunit S n=1 Tax=Escherichia coli TaxID=562 RepID=UPI001C05E87C|nr:restriction endonuclease subunit S [Escherichia coli]MBU0056614.1 restriction endonuclease subunit S [Escherichia coli]MBU0152484.1 restriction endonuclease subunit S [Escherichia coli]MBU0184408.1 restriction endonuclease subunit S [Escherichia coli]MBU0255644.1 restriction endonuclease subunit S [Escherichia coli]MCF1940283.1 restriction endonuclease subunit S [Escherichia coli]
MSEMSYLEKLLDGVEVEWLPLGEVSALRRGKVMSKGYLTENFGPYPVYSSQTANNGKIGSINTFDFDGEYISWTTDGANAGTVFYRTGKFSITNVCGLITLKSKYPLIYKFLFYWLTIEAKKHVYSGMGNPKLMSHQVENIPVPIPCPDNPEKSLAIQSEIVRILDKFTALTAELTAELNMRKKQYNYYRDQLLSFKEGEVEWKTLGDISIKIASGRNKSRKSEGEYPVYGSTGLIGSTDKAAYSGKLILVARVGAYAGLVNAVAGHFDVSDNTLIIQPSDRWNVRFAFHQLTYMNLNQYAVGAGQPLITGGFLKNLMVPLPSLDEQTRIANILDKFDTLTNSITEGLPREIELRQKQYEYYRDMLFSFPKPEVAEA